MSAAARRQWGRLLGSLARHSSTSAALQPAQTQQVVVIAAEVAQLVSQRGGMTALPPDVTAAVELAAKGGAMQTACQALQATCI